MDIQRNDCLKMISALWNQEEIRGKKRRWIVGDPTLSVDSEKTLKKTKFLPESLLRSSQVIESSLGLRLGESYHVVQDYVQLFEPQALENPVIFQKRMSVLLVNLKTQTLNSVLDIVREGNIDLERNKSAENGIEEVSRKLLILLESHNYNNIVKKLAAVFRDPINYRNKMKLTTVVNAQLISSITKTLGLIDFMPKQTLLAMKRKFNCVQVVPQIPVCSVDGSVPVVREVKKACDEVLYVLEEGDELPEPFAKALSVMLLSIKLSSRKLDMRTSEFFPFNSEIVALQDEILKAIWTIPKVKIAELKMLRSIVDPTCKLTLRQFRSGVVKYLTEFLFECGDVDIPKLLTEVLSFINRKSKRHLAFARQVSHKDEVEQVMNISAQLRQIIWYNFPADDIEHPLSDSNGLHDDHSPDDGDDIIFDDKVYSDLGECNVLFDHGPFTGGATEGAGDSEPADFFAAHVSSRSSQAHRNGKPPENQQNTNATSCSLSDLRDCLNAPSTLCMESVCDETAVLAYEIIDQVLEGLQGTESRENHKSTKLTKKDAKKIDILDSMGPNLLAQTVEKLAPNFPKSGLEKMKKLMGLS